MGKLSYFPHTEEDVRAMLERIGVNSLDDLFSDVPADFVFKGEYDLPSAMSEQQVRDYFEKLASMNTKLKVFVGQGAYDHYIPSVIPYITGRSEFITAYTPYQCEISQGTLRYIFEWQSMICRLTGMDIANASVYDGPTAAAEAMRMCIACTKKRNSVIVAASLLPNVIDTIRTYARYSGINVIVSEHVAEDVAEGVLDLAGVIVPSVNRYGIVENHAGLAGLVHGAGALLVEYCDPSTLAVLKTPAEWGADIAVGDGQSLGIPLCYGGPYVGFMACRNEFMRKLPGRIVGQTTDAEGRRCFVLTLQAREQHIRREKATSNICSNESLLALWCTVYLSLMGPEGMKRVNELSFDGAHYLYSELMKTGLFEEVFPNAPFINEFVLKPLCPADKLQQALLDGGYFAALQTEEGYVTFCVTEKHSREEIDGLVAIVKEVRI
ncbi:MAG: aminomethyl-transferring glycine dehydrogenase subunit GcvPA [Bacteroidales bacterium]|nr:aminomethyl-transferring glycine dehydrogenase subunit GcvPA [Bacteroidales bacterium]MDY2877797.1 aminomethyl-transferring glycine dehydrogenase subunit GcvPA [Candidatus Cryptobacteroides sp.]